MISQFLLLPTPVARAQWLRERTDHGKQSLPVELWNRPNISDISRLVERPDSKGPNAGQERNQPRPGTLLNVYSTLVEPRFQFQDFIRTNGFGEFTHEEVDPEC